MKTLIFTLFLAVSVYSADSAYVTSLKVQKKGVFHTSLECTFVKRAKSVYQVLPPAHYSPCKVCGSGNKEKSNLLTGRRIK